MSSFPNISTLKRHFFFQANHNTVLYYTNRISSSRFCTKIPIGYCTA